MMNRYLRMVFRTNIDKLVAIRVTEVRDSITPAEVKGVMEAILATNAVTTASGDLVSVDGAFLVETSTTELSVS